MRSERRHHRERLKKIRRCHWGRELQADPRQWGLAIDTPTPCSCHLCGNPRRLFGERTVQERRFDAIASVAETT